MREILFRGKRLDNGEWVEGGVLCYAEYTAICVYSDYNNWHEFIEVVPKTVCQFTGLTDKNGVKIFEGDVVDILTENEEIGVVKYEDGGFLVSADGFCVDFHSNINGTDLEVIGNIFDNPELMKGGAV